MIACNGVDKTQQGSILEIFLILLLPHAKD